MFSIIPLPMNNLHSNDSRLLIFLNIRSCHTFYMFSSFTFKLPFSHLHLQTLTYSVWLTNFQLYNNVKAICIQYKLYFKIWILNFSWASKMQCNTLSWYIDTLSILITVLLNSSSNSSIFACVILMLSLLLQIASFCLLVCIVIFFLYSHTWCGG